MMIVETGAAGMTLLFLCIVTGLAAALIALFFTIERSSRMMQFRQAVIGRIDRRFGQDVRDGHR